MDQVPFRWDLLCGLVTSEVWGRGLLDWLGCFLCLLLIRESSVMMCCVWWLLRAPGVRINEIAWAFGISAATIDNWLNAERIGSEERPGVTKAESEELQELCKRSRLL